MTLAKAVHFFLAALCNVLPSRIVHGAAKNVPADFCCPNPSLPSRSFDIILLSLPLPGKMPIPLYVNSAPNAAASAAAPILQVQHVPQHPGYQLVPANTALQAAMAAQAPPAMPSQAPAQVAAVVPPFAVSIAAAPMPVAIQAPPVQVALADHKYLVYRFAPTEEHPFHHWKYFPQETSQDQLPDIRVARPLYIWSSNTGEYTPVQIIMSQWA
ncbi:hypothetical protein BZA77DRAFT_297044 [Pyronema omphalodes]|nr:hypothetical protein BZA77DRAFT_297044 [Pyronema omphalodes]